MRTLLILKDNNATKFMQTGGFFQRDEFCGIVYLAESVLNPYEILGKTTYEIGISFGDEEVFEIVAVIGKDLFIFIPGHQIMRSYDGKEMFCVDETLNLNFPEKEESGGIKDDALF